MEKNDTKNKIEAKMNEWKLGNKLKACKEAGHGVTYATTWTQ